MLIDPVSLVLAALAGVVALAIGWLQFPRPPALDGERWFKVALATTLRGALEPRGVEVWEEAVIRQIPYHPAGRFPERKLSNPVAAALPGAALPGEIALLEALARRSDPEERLRYLYEEDVEGVDARLTDPVDLGEDYAFGAFGPEGTWESLAAAGAGDERFVAAARRSVAARWVLVEGRLERRVGPPVLDALARLLPDATRIPFGAELSAILEPLLPQVSDRVVLVAEEAAVTDVLHLLVEDLGLREHVLAVVSLGGVIGGRTDEDGPYGEAKCQDWLGAHFRQTELDTDVVRLTPYFALQWLTHGVWPPGVPGLPLQASRFPEPDATDAPVITVEAVDLGLLPTDRDLPADAVARALIAVVCGWVASRR